MSNFLVIARDSVQNPIPNAKVTCGLSTAITDQTGTVLLSTSIAIGQSATITVAAAGFSPQTVASIATQYTQVVTAVLIAATSLSRATVTITNGISPVAGARIFVGGLLAGTTDTHGNVTFQIPITASVLEIVAGGFVLSRTSIFGSVPDVLVLQSAGAPGRHITIVSSPPGAPIQIAGEQGFLGPDGTYTTVNLFAPGTYPVVLGNGGAAVTSTITTT